MENDEKVVAVRGEEKLGGKERRVQEERGW